MFIIPFKIFDLCYIYFVQRRLIILMSLSVCINDEYIHNAAKLLI